MSLAATRQWSEEEWSAAIARLAGLGWVEADGRLTDAGAAARDQIELDTDRLCTPIWNVVGDTGAARFNELISPIHDAMAAAGTYTALV